MEMSVEVIWENKIDKKENTEGKRLQMEPWGKPVWKEDWEILMWKPKEETILRQVENDRSRGVQRTEASLHCFCIGGRGSDAVLLKTGYTDLHQTKPCTGHLESKTESEHFSTPIAIKQDSFYTG